MYSLGLALVALLGQGDAGKPAPPPKVTITEMTVGTGEPVALGDEVTVDYTGMLPNGKVFDTSKKPGREPFTLLVGISPVIQGWHQGLVGMKLNGVRKLTIPAALGY